MTDGKKRTISKLTSSFGVVSARRRTALNFAKKHGLIYFDSVSPDGPPVPVIRNSTTSSDQVDAHFCIGTHAGYDMALVDRLASVKFDSFRSSVHRWYVLEIDLRRAKDLPYMFVGTRQQTKAYYARLLSAHRQLRYMALTSGAQRNVEFHSHYAVLASPADVQHVYRLLTDETIDKMAAHKYPFAFEIDGDSLYVITDAQKPSQQLLDKLLHYGLWLAGEIDQRLV